MSLSRPAHFLISSQILSSTAVSVSFSNFDTAAAGYRDLVLVASNLKVTGSGGSVRVRFNSDISSMYNTIDMDATTTSSGSFLTTTNSYFSIDRTSLSTTIPSSYTVEIFDFNQTDKHKNIFAQMVSSANRLTNNIGRWPSTAAVTNIEFYSSRGTAPFAIGSKFSLYGVLA